MQEGCSTGGAVRLPTRWGARAFRIALLGAAMLTFGATAFAQPTAADKETARNLMDQGDAAYVSKDYDAALRAYEAADEIMGVPTTGIEVAKAQEALGKLVEARDTLLRVMRYPKKAGEPTPFTKARQQAEIRAAKLAERIPSVTVVVTGLQPGQSATVKVDGRALHAAAVGVPRKLNPGKHTIEVTAAGYADATRSVDLAERADERVEIALQPATEAPAAAPPAMSEEPAVAPPPTGEPVEGDAGVSSSTSSLTYIGFGLAGVGLTAGAITGALAFSKTGTAKDQCTDNLCPPTAESDIDSAKTMGTISTVSFAVGFVGAAVGVYGLMNPSESDTSMDAAGSSLRVQPAIGLGSVGVTGRF